jgi:hypothetical protein
VRHVEVWYELIDSEKEELSAGASYHI